MLPLCKAFGTILKPLWKKGEKVFAADILERQMLSSWVRPVTSLIC